LRAIRRLIDGGSGDNEIAKDTMKGCAVIKETVRGVPTLTGIPASAVGYRANTSNSSAETGMICCV
jgi:hypothetical protein